MEEKMAAYVKSCTDYYLQPGFMYVAEQPTAIRTVLGSCISVCIHDQRLKYGGMNHFLLPQFPSHSPTPRYGRPATLALVRTFLEFGSRKEDLVAKIVGGASMAGSPQSCLIGKLNVETARATLRELGVPVISEDVGGVFGRKILFLGELNRILVAKLTKIRAIDFMDSQTEDT